MKAVVQRVTRAAVRVDGQTIGEIGSGLLVLLGIGRGDTEPDRRWMINKLLNLRIFADDAGKMNRSATDVGGGLLIVSQFTLYGDVRQGMRPGFSAAMPPAEAETFYGAFMVELRAATRLRVESGKFAAIMDVELINDGPVTIVVESGTEASADGQPQVERATRPFKPGVKLADKTDSAAEQPPVERATRPFNASANLHNEPPCLFQPFDPKSSIAVHDRNLPHWQQPGCTYFATFRLADSIPQTKLNAWKREREAWLKDHPSPRNDLEEREYQTLFGDRLQQWLDAGYGECVLRQPVASELLEETMQRFGGKRYTLGRFVIMPNHVHALVTPFADFSLESIMHSWKSYSAHRINKLLQRAGKIWQDEYFDHIVRDETYLAQFEAYIGQNPEIAGLSANAYRLG